MTIPPRFVLYPERLAELNNLRVGDTISVNITDPSQIMDMEGSELTEDDLLLSLEVYRYL